jgi:hypothetical protein
MRSGSENPLAPAQWIEETEDLLERTGHLATRDDFTRFERDEAVVELAEVTAHARMGGL